MDWPFIKFYFRDWQSDTELRMCSLESRGFWLECMGIMNCAKRRGYLESPNGQKLSEKHIALLAGTNEETVKRCMAELLEHGVPDVEPNTGKWICRRMVKDTLRSRIAIESGKKGGNPALKKGREFDVSADLESCIKSFKFTKERERAIELWINHAKEQGKHYRVTSLRTLLIEWQDKSDEEFARAVQASVAANAKNIFEPDDKREEAERPEDKRYPDCPAGVVPMEFGGDYIRPGNKTDERIYNQKMGLV